MLVIVIGRGHGGTRLASETLSRSGVFMGPVNESGDLVPPENMYAAAAIAGKTVRMTGRHEWDFSTMLETEPPDSFRKSVLSYLVPITESGATMRGWKLPETVLALPWIQKMFPDAHYIHWVRDPRGSVSGGHITDNLSRFGIPSERENSLSLLMGNRPKPGDATAKRVESWVYHEEIVRATPRPRNFISVKYENFVLHQDAELSRLSEFLNIPLKKVDVRPEMAMESAYCPTEVLERYGYLS